MFSVVMGYNIFDPEPCIILLGKQFIYRCKASESKPIFSMFKGLLHNMFVVENDIALDGYKLVKHEQKWNHYKKWKDSNIVNVGL